MDQIVPVLPHTNNAYIVTGDRSIEHYCTIVTILSIKSLIQFEIHVIFSYVVYIIWILNYCWFFQLTVFSTRSIISILPSKNLIQSYSKTKLHFMNKTHTFVRSVTFFVPSHFTNKCVRPVVYAFFNHKVAVFCGETMVIKYNRFWILTFVQVMLNKIFSP